MQEFHENFPFDDAFFEVELPIPPYSYVHDEIPLAEESVVLP